jgi:hypothetical protein
VLANTLRRISPRRHPGDRGRFGAELKTYRIQEAQFHIDRLQRRYLGGDKRLAHPSARL